MKKVFLILCLILHTLSSYAADNKKQKSNYPKIKFGAEGGLNLANIIYHTPAPVTIPTAFTITWHAGVYSSIDFSDKLTLQPELLYDVKGVTFPNEYTVHDNYIEIPLELKYNIGKQFFLFAGPYMAIQINWTSTAITTTYSNLANNLPNENTLDMGAVIGIEHQWANGFNIGLKYNQGFYNIAPHSIGYIPAYPLVLSLYVGWTFIKFSGNR